MYQNYGLKYMLKLMLYIMEILTADLNCIFTQIVFANMSISQHININSFGRNIPEIFLTLFYLLLQTPYCHLFLHTVLVYNAIYTCSGTLN